MDPHELLNLLSEACALQPEPNADANSKGTGLGEREEPREYHTDSIGHCGENGHFPTFV